MTRPTQSILAALCVILFGCAYANSRSHWPSRGAMFCRTNTTNQVVRVIQQDGQLRILPFGERVAPGKRTCARWAFIHGEGRFGTISGPDTTWGDWFKPWEPR